MEAGRLLCAIGPTELTFVALSSLSWPLPADEDFVYFILSEEDKTTDASLDYWFRCALPMASTSWCLATFLPCPVSSTALLPIVAAAATWTATGG